MLISIWIKFEEFESFWITFISYIWVTLIPPHWTTLNQIYIMLKTLKQNILWITFESHWFPFQLHLNQLRITLKNLNELCIVQSRLKLWNKNCLPIALLKIRLQAFIATFWVKSEPQPQPQLNHLLDRDAAHLAVKNLIYACKHSNRNL